MRALIVASTLAAWLLAVACSEEIISEPEGRITFTAVTSGGDEDADGYLVVLDGIESSFLPPDGEVTITGLAAGRYEYQLEGVEPNCDVHPAASGTIELQPTGAPRVSFEVSCFASGFTIQSIVDGLDAGQFYTIRLNGVSRPEQLNVGEQKTITGLAAGRYLLELGNVPGNCVLTPLTQEIDVALRVVKNILVSSRCTATHGAVSVNVTVTGRDVDLDGFEVAVDGEVVMGVQSNAGATQGSIIPGPHQVSLEDVAANCTVSGTPTRSILIAAGGMTRDTVTLSFTVDCQRFWGLALARGDTVALATSDGATVDLGPSGSRPAWSPDGRVLAWTCGNICTFEMDSGPRIANPNPGLTLSGPAWRSDGRRLAFVAQFCSYYYYYYYSYCEFRGLYVTRPDGGGGVELRLPPQVTGATNPAWSPDGQTIAFGCLLIDVGFQKVCSIRSDGTGFRAITAAAGHDGHPSWSPDGSRLVFSTTRFGDPELATVNADGTDLKQFSPVVRGRTPQWAPDGRILFTHGVGGIAIMSGDGTGITRLTTSVRDSLPALRP